ncbi:MAG: ABC transporter permease subunit [Acidobacteriota bacterium]
MIERWGTKRFAAGLTLTYGLALIAVLPPLSALMQSFQPPASEGWSGSAYRYVLDTYGSSLTFSLRLALFVVVASLLLGVPAAYGLVRHPFRGSRLVEQLTVVPLAVPGISIAMAIIIGYSAQRGQWLLLAAGHMLYTVAYVVRIVMNTLRNLPLRELDDAARTLGASRLDRLRRIVAPLLAAPVALASLIVFAISWGEFNVSFLLATPTQLPFPAALYGTYTSNSGPVAAAATAIFLLGALPLIIAVQLAGRSRFDYGQGA